MRIIDINKEKRLLFIGKCKLVSDVKIIQVAGVDLKNVLGAFFGKYERCHFCINNINYLTVLFIQIVEISKFIKSI